MLALGVVLGHGAAAGGLGAGVEGGHGGGLPAAGLHQFHQGGPVSGQVLGHAHAGAVAAVGGGQAVGAVDRPDGGAAQAQGRDPQARLAQFGQMEGQRVRGGRQGAAAPRGGLGLEGGPVPQVGPSGGRGEGVRQRPPHQVAVALVQPPVRAPLGARRLQLVR